MYLLPYQYFRLFFWGLSLRYMGTASPELSNVYKYAASFDIQG